MDSLIERTGIQCSAEWHISRFESEIALAIYNLALKISKHGRFHASAATLAEYFDADIRTSYRALDELEQNGWFVRISAEPGKSKIYKPIKHSEWAKTRAGECRKMPEPLFFSDGDPLGRALYAASGGRMKFFPNYLKCLRKYDMPTEDLVECLQALIEWEKPAGKQWRQRFFQKYHAAVRALAAARAA